MPTILVAEDDTASREFLCKFLTREGYAVVAASGGVVALELAPQADLALLDVMMPELNGWELAPLLRQDYPELPIIMLTALATVDAQVQGLELGADDYITKPYDLRALGARIRALLRRTNLKQDLSFGPLRIKADTRETYLKGERLELSRVEFDLLLTLAQYAGHVFSRERLLERIWGRDYFGTDRVVDVRMVALRKKLGDDGREPQFIETVRGLGYRFKAA